MVWCPPFLAFNAHSIAPNKEHETTNVVVTHVPPDAYKMLILIEQKCFPLSLHCATSDTKDQFLFTIVEIDCFQEL